MSEVEFGEWLKKQLEERRLSMSEAGRRGGISHSRISQVVAGGEKPGWELVAAIARALNLPLAYVAHKAGRWAEYREEPEADIVIHHYKALPPDRQKMIRDLLRHWSERHGEE
jgi:transcriptional regulator with XRE-family HTH domain